MIEHKDCKPGRLYKTKNKNNPNFWVYRVYLGDGKWSMGTTLRLSKTHFGYQNPYDNSENVEVYNLSVFNNTAPGWGVPDMPVELPKLKKFVPPKKEYVYINRPKV